MRNELYHHGIEGQKWGVRNGPPYPLNRNKSIDKQSKQQYGLFQKFKLSSAIESMKRSDKFDSDLIDGKYEKLSELKRKLLTDDTIEEDMDVINQNHSSDYGRTNNCVYCSYALEMRVRGYDVEARGSYKGIVGGEISKYFKDVTRKLPNMNNEKLKRIDFDSNEEFDKAAMKNVLDSIKEDGNESRGIFTITYKNVNSGHAMYYVSKDGDVKIYDPQQNKERSIDDLIKVSKPTEHAYYRLDNKEPNENITELVVSRKKDRW